APLSPASATCRIFSRSSSGRSAAATSMMRYSPTATLCVELPLESFIESDKLPTEAEPALDADEAKLSAPHGTATTMPTRSAQANRDAEKVIRVFQWGAIAGTQCGIAPTNIDFAGSGAVS